TSVSYVKPACLRDSTIDKYASGNSTYFPTKPIVIVLDKFLTRFTNFSHSTISASSQSRCKCSHANLSRPCSCSAIGTWYSVSASNISITARLSVSQNSAILFLLSCSTGYSVLNTIASGGIRSDGNMLAL